MKMENIVKSPTTGTVTSIVSKAGETVHKGDVIIKF
ncbi:MAG: biotin/lipoyl-containing protein [Bacteroidota bacterium]